MTTRSEPALGIVCRNAVQGLPDSRNQIFVGSGLIPRSSCCTLLHIFPLGFKSGLQAGKNKTLCHPLQADGR